MTTLALVLAFALAGNAPVMPPDARAPNPSEARAFIARVNGDLKRLWTRQATAD